MVLSGLGVVGVGVADYQVGVEVVVFRVVFVYRVVLVHPVALVYWLVVSAIHLPFLCGSFLCSGYSALWA